jgi:hypothetical protein
MSNKKPDKSLVQTLHIRCGATLQNGYPQQHNMSPLHGR